MSAEERIDELERGLIGARKRRLRRLAARNAWLLEIRNEAYRRLLARNAGLEADKRALDRILAVVNEHTVQLKLIPDEIVDWQGPAHRLSAARSYDAIVNVVAELDLERRLLVSEVDR